MHTMTRVALLALLAMPAFSIAEAQAVITCNQQGCSDWPRHAAPKAEKGARYGKRSHQAKRMAETDANGNAATVRSRSGIAVRVSPSAHAALQCIVNYVEGAGVKIKAMRGYGRGTVRASLHPGGRALDINQTARDVTHPKVPRSVSNAAADQCGVISGARWGYADNGHWNLAVTGQSREPWPRVLN